MGHRSTEVDAYIAASAPFARPILRKIRGLFHRACPRIEETIKWGFPHFEYMGVVAGMAAFKRHVSFGFWKGRLLSDPHGLFKGAGQTGMNARKLTDVSELPADDVLIDYIREAVALNENNVKLPARKKAGPRKSPPVPDDLQAALHKNPKALAGFEALPPSHQREYIEWITEARKEETRQRRIQTAIEWLTKGQSRNRKYERC
ncbi:MAG: hypothetical protein AMXMBFR83_11600 [Phycisphaerae bacterium]